MNASAVGNRAKVKKIGGLYERVEKRRAHQRGCSLGSSFRVVLFHDDGLPDYGLIAKVYPPGPDVWSCDEQPCSLRHRGLRYRYVTTGCLRVRVSIRLCVTCYKSKQCTTFLCLSVVVGCLCRVSGFTKRRENTKYKHRCMDALLLIGNVSGSDDFACQRGHGAAINERSHPASRFRTLPRCTSGERGVITVCTRQ